MSEHATRTIVYTVTGQQISCDYAAPSAVNESCRYLQAMFSVDDTWSGLRIEAIFYNRSVMADPVELDESMICEVPAVVLQKPEREFYCGIVGYGDDGYRLTSDSIGVDLDGAAYTHGRTPSQPDPDLYARILEGLNKKLDANQGKENKGKALIINDDGDIVPGEVQDTTDHPLYLCQLSTAAPFTLDHTYAEVVEADAAGYAVAAKWGKYIFTLRTVSDTVAQFACADLEFRDYGVTLLTFNLPADGTEVNGIYAKVPFAGAEAGGVICADDATEADTVPARIGEDGKLYVAAPPPMTGATETEAGAAGLVPAPAAGEQDMVLHGDGTWRFPLPAVTADSNGAFLRVVDGAWAAEMLTDVSKEGA